MKTSWQTKKLGDICDFQRGLTYSKKDEVNFSENIVLRATNIDLKTNTLDFSELKYINDDFIVPINKKVREGSIIICTASGSKGHLGKAALIDKNYDYAFGGFMAQITPKNDIDGKYLFKILTSNLYNELINRISSGANIHNLKFSDLENFEIPVPPLPEQKRIVKKLDDIFANIEKAKVNTEKNLKNSKELFESALWTMLKYGESGWGEKELREVCDKISAGGDVPKNNFSKHKSKKYNIPIFANGMKDKGLYGYTDSSKINRPSITISARGTIGYTEIRVDPFYPIVRLIVLTPNVGVVDLVFLYYVIRNFVFANTGTSIPQLTIPMVQSIKIPIPAISEQKAIVAKLDLLSAETQKLEAIYTQKLEDLEELKKSILKKAFAGEL